MQILRPSDLEPVLAGDARARRDFVEALTPVVKAHVVRGLFRHRWHARGRDIRQEIEDMVQSAFSVLFEEQGKALRAWSPERGLSFEKFIGLVAERHVAAIFRSGRKSPWRDGTTALEELDSKTVLEMPETSTERRIEQRDFGQTVVSRLAGDLSPRGLELFRMLFVEEQTIAEVTGRLRVSPDVVYAWRHRIIKRARQIGSDLERNVVGAVRNIDAAHKGRREMNEISDVLTQLESLPFVLRSLIQRAPIDEAIVRGPGPSFTLLEHVWHLADLEREAFSVRIARILEEDNPRLPDFDGDAEAKARRYRERDLHAGLIAFASARADNLARLERVPPGAWQRTATQDGVGALTLTDIPCRMLEHDQSHAAELIELFTKADAAHLVLPALGELARAAKPLPCAA